MAQHGDPLPIGALLQMVGTGLSAYGSYQQAKVRSGELEYEAYIAQQDAILIEEAGEAEQAKVRTAKRRLLARAIAIAAASGRNISGGSPLAIIESLERAAVLDEQTIAFNKRIAMGRKKGEVSLLKGAGRIARASGKLGLYSSLLSVGGQGVILYRKKQLKARAKAEE